MTTTKQFKPSPTGVLLLPATAPKEDWLEARKTGITATDIPAILGLNKYKTAIDVWTDKIGTSSDNFTPGLGHQEAAFWGIQLEDTVAKAWAEQTGVTVRRIGIIHNENNPWMLASLDRMVTGCKDGKCALEVKTRSGYVGEEWDKGVPADVEAQVLWQLMVSGLDHIHVIALIGGQRLVQHKVTLGNTRFVPIDVITNAMIVWVSVESGEAPQLPQELWTDDFLNALHPDRSGEVEVDDEASDLLNRYERINAEITALTKDKDELKTKLIGSLGEAEVATSNGRALFTYKAQTSKRIDTKALAELHPDAANDDRIWNTTSSRILRITTKKGTN